MGNEIFRLRFHCCANNGFEERKKFTSRENYAIDVPAPMTSS